jgi:hypothetical protein
MNYTLEKTERYALVRINENEVSGELPATLEKLAAGFFREGYSNIILELASAVSIDPLGTMALRKINRNCSAEDGLLVVVTKDEAFIDLLDAAKLIDLAILPTVEEAVDAVLMNDLENDFRNEDDSEYGTAEGDR